MKIEEIKKIGQTGDTEKVCEVPEKKPKALEDPELLLRELKGKNRLFNKLLKEGKEAGSKDIYHIKRIQKDLKKTIKELEGLIKILPEIEES